MGLNGGLGNMGVSGRHGQFDILYGREIYTGGYVHPVGGIVRFSQSTFDWDDSGDTGIAGNYHDVVLTLPSYTAEMPGTSVKAAARRPPVQDSAVAMVQCFS